MTHDNPSGLPLDGVALLAAFRVNHHPDAEPSSMEMKQLSASIRAYLAALPAPSEPAEQAAPAAKVGALDAIYIASKTKHAERWRQIASVHPVSSTWIYEAGQGETNDFDDLWWRCLREASTSKALVVYREPGEVLKGAWVEVGAALAHGVPVHAVGLDEFTIAKYRGITHHATMKDAMRAALKEPARRPVTAPLPDAVGDALSPAPVQVATDAEKNYEAFRTFTHDATKAITGLTGGGSEYFGKEIDGVFLADLPRCVDRLRARLDRATLSASRRASGAGGWMLWTGGKCPVPKNTEGLVRVDDGEVVYSRDISDFNWFRGHDGPVEGRQIEAYHVIAAPHPSKGGEA